MQDEKILAKLNELKLLMLQKEYAICYQNIVNWIVETQTEIATESAKSVGMGTAMASIKKIIKSNKKAHPEWAYLIRSSKKACIVSDGSMAIKFKQDIGLPATSLQKDYADKVLANIERWSKECDTAITTPRRAELDVVIKDWKAIPKCARPSRPVYDFGHRLPKVDAEQLMDILPVFPANHCYVSKTHGTISPLYFKWETYEGLLMPITR